MYLISSYLIEDRGHDSPLVRPEPRLRNQVLELAAEVRRQRAHQLRCAVGQRRRVGCLVLVVKL